MIKYREQSKDERLSATHICPRCETEQLRGQLHHCTATEARKADVENPVPPPRTPSRGAKGETAQAGAGALKTGRQNKTDLSC
jgi:hypothetical protein